MGYNYNPEINKYNVTICCTVYHSTLPSVCFFVISDSIGTWYIFHRPRNRACEETKVECVTLSKLKLIVSTDPPISLN